VFSGRAGRDGLPAKSVLYYSADDKSRKRFLLESSLEARRQKKAVTAEDNAHDHAVLESFNKMIEYCEKPIWYGQSTSSSSCCSTTDHTAHCDMHSRRKQLLAYFGEQFALQSCGNCDFCADPEKVKRQTERALIIGSNRPYSMRFVHLATRAPQRETERGRERKLINQWLCVQCHGTCGVTAPRQCRRV
jgi:bloom syndrome protein